MMQICLGSGVQGENITVGIQHVLPEIYREDATKKRVPKKLFLQSTREESTPSENKLVFTLKSKGSFSHRIDLTVCHLWYLCFEELYFLSLLNLSSLTHNIASSKSICGLLLYILRIILSVTVMVASRAGRLFL